MHYLACSDAVLIQGDLCFIVVRFLYSLSILFQAAACLQYYLLFIQYCLFTGLAAELICLILCNNDRITRRKLNNVTSKLKLLIELDLVIYNKHEQFGQ